MAREVESFHQFTHKQSPWSLEKEVAVARCDDGAVYEFERPTDGRESFRLVRRFDPQGEMSLSRGVLPGAVKETVSDALPDWTK